MCESQQGEMDYTLWSKWHKINVKMGIKKELVKRKRNKRNLYEFDERLVNIQSYDATNKSRLIDSGSSRAFIHTYFNTTGVLNAIVMGGRTMNERNVQYIGNTIADVDFSSCYGAALANFNIPIGIMH